MSDAESKPKWLISGSVAAKHWFSDFRDPVDIDIITPVNIKSDTPTECMVDASWNDASDLILSKNKDHVFVDPDTLFSIKVSHAGWDVKWEKTMFDIMFFKNKGCQLDDSIYKAMIPVWKKIHGEKHVNLNQPVSEFFTDHVVRKFDHEQLHELAAFNGRPMHSKIRPDQTSAWCSKEMFDALTEEEQYEAALEEMIVTAIERSGLDSPASKVEKIKAINMAYKKLVTSMTTGWFCKFLILNQVELLKTRRLKWNSKMDSILQELKTLPM